MRDIRGRVEHTNWVERGFVLSRLLVLIGILWLLLLAALAAGFATLALRPFIQMPEYLVRVFVVWGVVAALVLAPFGIWMIRLSFRLRRRKK